MATAAKGGGPTSSLCVRLSPLSSLPVKLLPIPSLFLTEMHLKEMMDVNGPTHIKLCL